MMLPENLDIEEKIYHEVSRQVVPYSLKELKANYDLQDKLSSQPLPALDF